MGVSVKGRATSPIAVILVSILVFASTQMFTSTGVAYAGLAAGAPLGMSAQGVSFAGATAINVNASRSGSMSKTGEEAWYKFTIKEAGRLDLQMSTTAIATSGSWEVSLYDSSKNRISDGHYRLDDTPTQTMVTTGLSAGTYYVQVRSVYHVNGITYKLTPLFSANANWESEINDSFTAANSIRVNTGCFGTSESSAFMGDVDWFKFTVDKPGWIELRVYSETTATSGNWNVQLADSSNTELAAGNYLKGGASTQTPVAYRVNAGTYYIKVRGYYHNGVEVYCLTPSFSPLRNMSSASVKCANKTYTGYKQEPVPNVKYGETVLKKDKDYTVSYSRNVNAGVAKVTITGLGLYTGAKTVDFKIAKAKNPITVSAYKRTVYASSLQKRVGKCNPIWVYGAKGKVTYKKISGSKRLIISKSTGTVKIKRGTKRGVYKMKVRIAASGSKNYAKTTRTKTVVVKVV